MRDASKNTPGKEYTRIDTDAGADTDAPCRDDNGLPVEPSAALLLMAAVFVLAICGLVYELVAGTISSYLLGDSVTQFSLVIGLYLTSMGIGSFLSKYFKRHLLARLAAVEIAVGAVGGFMALAGLATFSYTELYRPVLTFMVVVVGILVGLEIPLLVRIFRGISSLRISLSHVLCADYLGALAAAIAFPFLLLPHVGLVRACLVMGLLNVAVAGMLVYRFRKQLRGHVLRLGTFAAVCAAALGVATGFSGRAVTFLEDRLYQDDIIYAADTPYQRLVVTRWRDDIRLFLDGHLQFSSVDEYRYHEALVHPAMALAGEPRDVLILGGGDGLAARQVLKHPGVRRIDLVDIDPAVTKIFRDNPMLADLNQGVLSDPRVKIHSRDAMNYLQDSPRLYDVILIDLPDPSSPSLGKMYAQSFYRLVARRLRPGGAIAGQCTSPFRSRQAYWCIIHTMRRAFAEMSAPTALKVYPYHTHVPTFGQWGFAVAGPPAAGDPRNVEIDVPVQYLTEDILPGLFAFPPDMAEVDTPVSRLNDPVVCRLYRSGYHKYLE